jgi:trigger factor
MNVKHEMSDALVQELVIEIAKDDYIAEVEKELKKQRRTAQVPGFRVGNAPMPMIKRLYEKHLISDEVNKLTSNTLYNYFEENKIDTIFEPMVIDEKSTIDFENSDHFVFTFEFATRPTFELDLASLPVVKTYQVLADQKQIDEYVSQIRKRQGEYSNPDSIGDDDYVTLHANDQTFNFFSNDLSDAGKAILVGKNLNDKIENVSLKEAFANEMILKKALRLTDETYNAEDSYTYNVEIGSIGRVGMAEINDAFFAKAFPDGSVTNMEQLETYAAGQITAQWKQETDRKFMNDAITTIIDHTKMELPETFIRRYVLKNATEPITEEKLDEEFPKYLNSFKWQLIENRIAETENLQVSMDDVEAYIRNFYYQNYFKNFNHEDVADRLNELVKEQLKDQKQVKALYDQLFDEKMMQVLDQKMNIERASGDIQGFIEYISGQKMETEEKPKKTKKAVKSEEPTEETEKPKAKKTTKKKENE